MITAIVLFFQCLSITPHWLYWISRDVFIYIKAKQWKLFEGWGLHVYVGRFGQGKTCSMVNAAYGQAVKYPQLTIVTNLELKGFPVHTQILPLNGPQDILNAPENSLVLIDEIGTIFNSRDFASSKQSVPKILFQHLCQCRKRRLMIYATSQRWNFLDKQLRDIVATVRVCRVHMSHPFSRMGTVHVYDSIDYDRAFANPLLPCPCIRSNAYVQSDKIRNLYDTAELIENMLTMDYISDREIMENRGELVTEIAEVNGKAVKTGRRNARRL